MPPHRGSRSTTNHGRRATRTGRGCSAGFPRGAYKRAPRIDRLLPHGWNGTCRTRRTRIAGPVRRDTRDRRVHRQGPRSGKFWVIGQSLGISQSRQRSPLRSPKRTSAGMRIWPRQREQRRSVAALESCSSVNRIGWDPEVAASTRIDCGCTDRRTPHPPRLGSTCGSPGPVETGSSLNLAPVAELYPK